MDEAQASGQPRTGQRSPLLAAGSPIPSRPANMRAAASIQPVSRSADRLCSSSATTRTAPPAAGLNLCRAVVDLPSGMRTGPLRRDRRQTAARQPGTRTARPSETDPRPRSAHDCPRLLWRHVLRRADPPNRCASHYRDRTACRATPKSKASPCRYPRRPEAGYWASGLSTKAPFSRRWGGSFRGG